MKKESILQYVAGILIAIAMFFAGAYTQGLFDETTTKGVYGCLSDCFLFPAVLLGGIGALSRIAGEGAFDMMSYGITTLFQSMLHPRDKQETFYEYKLRKEEERKPWLKHWFLVGLACMAFSVLFLVLYLV